MRSGNSKTLAPVYRITFTSPRRCGLTNTCEACHRSAGAISFSPFLRGKFQTHAKHAPSRLPVLAVPSKTHAKHASAPQEPLCSAAYPRYTKMHAKHTLPLWLRRSLLFIAMVNTHNTQTLKGSPAMRPCLASRQKTCNVCPKCASGGHLRDAGASLQDNLHIPAPLRFNKHMRGMPSLRRSNLLFSFPPR